MILHALLVSDSKRCSADKKWCTNRRLCACGEGGGCLRRLFGGGGVLGMVVVCRPRNTGIIFIGYCGVKDVCVIRGTLHGLGCCDLGVRFIAGDWWSPQKPNGDFVCL